MRILRPAALVLLGVTLAAPGAIAAAPRATTHPSRQGASAGKSLVQQLQGLLVSLWSPEGCGIDPLGHSSCLPTAKATTPQVPTADAGCGMDPLGRCLTQP